MSQIKTVGIVGADWYNKGAEAMMRTVMAELGKRLCVCFTVFVTDKKLLKNNPFSGKENVDVVLLDTGKKRFLSDSFAVFLYKITGDEKMIKKSVNLSAISSCDSLVDIHGYAVHNKNKLSVHIFMMMKIWIVKNMGKKYFVFPQDVDYLNSFPKRFITKLLYKKADLIVVRGQTSFDNVTKMTGELSQLKICPDIAFLMPSADPQDGLFSRWYKQQADRTCVAVSVNKKVSRDVEASSYVDLLGETISKLIAKGYSVVLFPHDIRGSADTHDLRICGEILSLMKENELLHIYNIDAFDYEPGNYKWIVSHCSVALTSRFHMAVAALSQNVPVVTLGYSFKYMQLLSWVNCSDMALDGAKVESNEVLEYLHKALNEAPTLNKNLKKRNVYIAEKLNLFFDDVTAKMLV